MLIERDHCIHHPDAREEGRTNIPPCVSFAVLLVAVSSKCTVTNASDTRKNWFHLHITVSLFKIMVSIVACHYTHERHLIEVSNDIILMCTIVRKSQRVIQVDYSGELCFSVTDELSRVLGVTYRASDGFTEYLCLLFMITPSTPEYMWNTTILRRRENYPERSQNPKSSNQCPPRLVFTGNSMVLVTKSCSVWKAVACMSKTI
jgi:hypothetical protein